MIQIFTLSQCEIINIYKYTITNVGFYISRYSTGQVQLLCFVFGFMRHSFLSWNPNNTINQQQHRYDKWPKRSTSYQLLLTCTTHLWHNGSQFRQTLLSFENIYQRGDCAKAVQHYIVILKLYCGILSFLALAEKKNRISIFHRHVAVYHLNKLFVTKKEFVYSH